MKVVLCTVALALGLAGAASGAIPVSEPSSTAAVTTLELSSATWTGRSVSAANGVYYQLCARGPLRRCAIGGGAPAARLEAFALAARAFQNQTTDLVVVALPQSPTLQLLLVFERDVLAEPDAGSATSGRLYAVASLVTVGVEDSLILFRLPWSSTPGL